MPPCVPRDGLGNGFFSRKRDSPLACFIVPPWHRWLSLQKWRILFPLVIGEFFMTFPRINPHFCRNRLALHLAYIWVSQKIWWPTLVQQPLPWKYGEIWNQFKPRKPSEMSVIILSKLDCHLPNSQFRRKTSADWRPICFSAKWSVVQTSSGVVMPPGFLLVHPHLVGSFKQDHPLVKRHFNVPSFIFPKKAREKGGFWILANVT